MKKTLSLVIYLLFCSHLIQGEIPWGPDESLAFYEPCDPPSPCCGSHNPLAEAGVCLIRFHQEVISPADGPRSNFIPSSSQYTLDAMRKYGFAKGVAYGCDRLMRENSEKWIYKTTLNPEGKITKFDPVK
ncbi:MAG: membrane protein insertion efficiency factor YidD [Parachlamydiales bacterium]|jgi:hypothetical protein